MDNKLQIKKKNKILDAALQIFVRKGYSETRMDDIVHASGMSKGAIYHHYSSKRDLFLELIDFWEVHCFPNILDKKYIFYYKPKLYAIPLSPFSASIFLGIFSGFFK